MIVTFESLECSRTLALTLYFAKSFESKKFLSLSETALTFSNLIVSGAFHGGLTLKQQQKISKITKLMQFPCTDALSYSHLAEGKIDVVIQAVNKIWDINPLIPIIRAAGGIVTNWKNENAAKGGNILVTTNRTIHKKLLKLLKPVSR